VLCLHLSGWAIHAKSGAWRSVSILASSSIIVKCIAFIVLRELSCADG
jgi:hypothetical protein